MIEAKESGKTIKVLLADDNPTVLDTVLGFFKDTGIETIYAPDGKKACELAAKELPDIIVMDWEMPGMNGIGALEKLSADPVTKEIPVIVATGVMIKSDNLETALESGAVDFLRKPLDKREFNARIRAMLRFKEQHRIIHCLLEESLRQKERELAALSMFDFQKNELLSVLLDKLQRLDRITNHAYATEIKPIERELRNKLSMEKSWGNLKRHFEEVHPFFFDRLKKAYKSLTSNDHKLCAYLKIGLGNKEIAAFTNVERTSIDRALNRLKKKLNIPGDESLRQFVVNI